MQELRHVTHGHRTTHNNFLRCIIYFILANNIPLVTASIPAASSVITFRTRLLWTFECCALIGFNIHLVNTWHNEVAIRATTGIMRTWSYCFIFIAIFVASLLRTTGSCHASRRWCCWALTLTAALTGWTLATLTTTEAALTA